MSCKVIKAAACGWRGRRDSEIFVAKHKGVNMIKQIWVAGSLFLLLVAAGCQKSSTTAEILKSFPVDSMDGVLTQSGVTLDNIVSSDGKGSLKITASQPTTIRLYEVRDVTIENARLIYRARVKAENVSGQAYLEMWCVFPGSGEFFSRSLQSPITGTVDWSTIETPFFLQKGQKPELIKLNLVINGQGTVWVDDIALIKGPLR